MSAIEEIAEGYELAARRMLCEHTKMPPDTALKFVELIVNAARMRVVISLTDAARDVPSASGDR